jgi:hypothetical protein
VLASSGNSDSFFVSVDRGTFSLWDTTRSQDWVWDQMSDRNASDPVVYKLQTGNHTLIIKQRETGTKIDKILITNHLEFIPTGFGETQTPSEPDPEPELAQILFEAETGYLKPPMQLARDDSASNGEYIWTPDGSGTYFNPSENAGYAEYTFEVPTAGDYVIWGRVLAINGNNDSLFVSVDDGNYSLWDTKRSRNWTWDQVSDRNIADPVVYKLQAGKHTFIIKQREDGTKIDKILITNDIYFIPE